MKIILLKDISGLGKSGSTIIVKSGYARNYLVPYGMAIFSSLNNIQKLKKHNQELYSKEIKEIQNARLRILEIKKLGPITIFSKSRATGKLFGSIGPKEIFQSIKLLGFHIEQHELILQGDSIRKTGNYYVIFQPYKDVSCYILLKVISK